MTYIHFAMKTMAIAIATAAKTKRSVQTIEIAMTMICKGAVVGSVVEWVAGGVAVIASVLVVVATANRNS